MRVYLPVLLLTCPCVAIVPQIGRPAVKGNLRARRSSVGTSASNTGSVAARSSIDAAAALAEQDSTGTDTRILISQSEVDKWNRNIGNTYSRWAPILTQWATFGAITGAGAGALYVSGPLGASVAKIYLSSVASGTAWTLFFSCLMDGNEATIKRMGGTSAPARIRDLVASTALDAGLHQKPTAWVIPSEEPNAFAMTSGLLSQKPHAVAVTQGLINTLSQNEIHAVIAHEVGHIRHSDCGRAIQTASMVSGLRLTMRVGWEIIKSSTESSGSKKSKKSSSKDDDDEGSSVMAGLMLMGVGSVSYVASNLLRLSSSRAAEFAADATAMELVPDGGVHLASALKKIEGSTATRDALGGSHAHLAHMYISNSPAASQAAGFWEKAGALLSTHPKTTDRVAQLVPIAGSTAVEPVTAFAAFGKEVAGVLDDGLW